MRAAFIGGAIFGIALSLGVLAAALGDLLDHIGDDDEDDT